MSKPLGKFKYGNSMTISSCRHVCKFIFEDFFFQVRPNVKERRFDVYVHASIETSDGTLCLKDYGIIERFKDHWCKSKQWNLIILKKEESEN